MIHCWSYIKRLHTSRYISIVQVKTNQCTAFLVRHWRLAPSLFTAIVPRGKWKLSHVFLELFIHKPRRCVFTLYVICGPEASTEKRRWTWTGPLLPRRGRARRQCAPVLLDLLPAVRGRDWVMLKRRTGRVGMRVGPRAPRDLPSPTSARCARTRKARPRPALAGELRARPIPDNVRPRALWRFLRGVDERERFSGLLGRALVFQSCWTSRLKLQTKNDAFLQMCWWKTKVYVLLRVRTAQLYVLSVFK